MPKFPKRIDYDTARVHYIPRRRPLEAIRAEIDAEYERMRCAPQPPPSSECTGCHPRPADGCQFKGCSPQPADWRLLASHYRRTSQLSCGVALFVPGEGLGWAELWAWRAQGVTHTASALWGPGSWTTCTQLLSTVQVTSLALGLTCLKWSMPSYRASTMRRAASIVSWQQYCVPWRCLLCRTAIG